MINELNIRSAIRGIEFSDASPLRKVRLLLRLGKSLLSESRALGMLSERHRQAGEHLKEDRFRIASRRLLVEYDNVRARAVKHLRPVKPGIDFGYTPRKDVASSWYLGGELA